MLFLPRKAEKSVVPWSTNTMRDIHKIEENSIGLYMGDA